MTTAASPSSTRASERGGVTILIALILLMAMAVAAFGVSQTSLRELAITGNESTGRKAAEAGDAGIDWIITWMHSGGTSPTTFQSAVAQQVTNLDLMVGGDPSVPITYATDPSPADAANSGSEPKYGNANTAGVYRVFFRNVDYPTDLALTGYTDGSNGVTQNSVITQGFDTEIRYLGPAPRYGQGKPNNYFLLRSIGRATVGNTGQAFIARREVLLELPPITITGN